MRDIYAKRRRILLDGYAPLGMGGRWSRGALYVYARVPDPRLTSYEFCVNLLEQGNVLVFPGTGFGSGEGYVRTTLLQPEPVLVEAVSRMSAVLPARAAREGDSHGHAR